MSKKPFDLPNTIQSTKMDFDAGKITLQQAAEILRNHGFLPYDDCDRALRLMENRKVRYGCTDANCALCDGTVRVEVSGGVAECVSAPEWIQVEIVDHDNAGAELCDLCMTSGVNVSRTTKCGKCIGIECGCDATHESDSCECDQCTQCE